LQGIEHERVVAGIAYEDVGPGSAVELVVAGVTNLITMPVSILPLREKDLKITGSLTVKMTDFQIDPPVPTLALGLIRTDDEVKLSFEWMLSQRDPKSQSSKN
jgi:hypothetical protein